MEADYTDIELGYLSHIPQEKVDSIEEKEVITKSDIEYELSLVELRLRKEELESKQQDRKQRKEYADKIFILLCVYLVIVLGIVIVIASSLAELSDIVICMLLGTTTANIIGIFNFVAKYLFHTKD